MRKQLVLLFFLVSPLICIAQFKKENAALSLGIGFSKSSSYKGDSSN